MHDIATAYAWWKARWKELGISLNIADQECRFSIEVEKDDFLRCETSAPDFMIKFASMVAYVFAAHKSRLVVKHFADDWVNTTEHWYLRAANRYLETTVNDI